MPALRTHDAEPPNEKAVIEAEAAIEQRRAAQRAEKDARVERALDRLRYGENSLGGGYSWSGGLLRLR